MEEGDAPLLSWRTSGLNSETLERRTALLVVAEQRALTYREDDSEFLASSCRSREIDKLAARPDESYKNATHF